MRVFSKLWCASNVFLPVGRFLRCLRAAKTQIRPPLEEERTPSNLILKSPDTFGHLCVKGRLAAQKPCCDSVLFSNNIKTSR
jgi:hypothetical protein